MKILVFVEHDVIIRHFVHSGAFSDLIAAHDVVFVFPEPGYKRVTLDVSTLDLGAPYRHLTVHQLRLTVWKRLFQVNQLRWRPGKFYAVLRKLFREVIKPKAAALYTVLSLPGIYQLLRWRSIAKIRVNPYVDLDRIIDEEAPDLLVHPSVLEGVYINDLVATSEAIGVPLVVIMNSWDNPCTKRAIVGIPDWLLVWGPQTRQHAIDYVGMPPDKTIEFGAAQFEIYRNPPRITREEFCQTHDIDTGKRIVLYAGSSKGTDEYSHLETIELAIEDGELENLAVVYRPHPWGDGGKGGGRILDREWKHIRIEATMRTYLEQVRDGNKAMSFPDYRDTHDVLSSIDALVSPLSTIILEGAMHGKPTLCFLPIEETGARHFQMALPLKHFEDMFNSEEFPTTWGLEDLVPDIKIMLARLDDREYLERRATACNHFVTQFDIPYGQRLTSFCETIVQSAPQHSGASQNTNG